MSKLPKNKKSLIEFLKKSKGKPTSLTWIEIAEKFEITDSKGNTSGENARQIWKNYRKNNMTEKNITEEVKGSNDYSQLVQDLKDNNFKVKSIWTNGAKVNVSISPDTDKEEEETLENLKEQILNHIKNESPKFKKSVKSYSNAKTGIVVTADYHIGAYIEGLVKTKDYSIEIVIDYLDQVATDINSFKYSEVHLAILGDLIESFTGLNHINSWKGLESGAYGGNIIITVYEIIKDFLSKINNLSNVYMVSGNHDRVTSSNKEDVEGDVAKMLAYFLQSNCKNIEIEYHPMVITKVIDNICYVITHGHLGFSNKELGKVLFTYGKQGYYNVLLSGHLHTRRNSSNIITTQAIPEDAADYRALVCPSLFTGNFYSESNGWTSTAGYLVIENRYNKPLVLDIPLK